MQTGSWQLAGLPAEEAWRRLSAELAAAAASGRHPLHLLTVATVADDGSPASRTVVLRGFDADGRAVWFHTDIRSPKAGQIARDCRVALHWYDPQARLQIRIAARAAVHNLDPIARAAWQAAAAMSRACYGSAAAPGTPLSKFPPPPEPLEAADATGVANFAVIRCRFTAVELLALHATGHERILLHFDGDCPTRTILAP